jgi:hypothetical protein
MQFVRMEERNMSRTMKATAALVLAGVCGSVHGQSCEGQWLTPSPGFDREIRAMTQFQGELVVAGDFRAAPGIAAKNIARWNGVSWKAMNADMLNSPRALRVYNGELYVGGWFSLPFAPANGVAKWNGTGWGPLAEALPPSPLSPRVETLGEFQGMLLAAGRIRVTNGNPPKDGIMLWDGADWQNLGGVFGRGSVTTTAVFQGDLYVAGPSLLLDFDFQSGSVLRYNGSTWTKVGPNGLEGESSGIALRVYQDKLMIASGNVWTTGAASYGPLASWDGTNVSRVGLVGSVRGITAMTEYEGHLVLGGSFTDGFGVGANGVVRWNGTNFSALGDGVLNSLTTSRGVNCLDVFQDELLVGGDFDTAGGMSAANFARWTDNPKPWVAVEPESKPVNEGLTLTLNAAAASGYANVSYQWKRNGVDVNDGPGGASAAGGTVSGASGTLASPSDGASVSLTIAGVQASDAGDYTIEFDNTCNAATSSIATVSVNTCPGDLNADGFVNDTDFGIFSTAYDTLMCDAASMPIGCLSDWNGDGVVDDADFQVFVAAYVAMVCE